MTKSIKTRIEDSFFSDDKESVKYYLDALAATLKDHADGIRRPAALMLGLMAAFQLLLRGLIKEINIGPLVLSSTGLIVSFIPTVVAYLYYDAIGCAINYENTADVYAHAFAVWNNAAESNDLDALVRPRTPPYFPASGGIRSSISRFAQTEYNIRFATFILLGLLAPIGFQVYAFYQLFGVLHPSSILLWLNASATALLLTAAFWEATTYGREGALALLRMTDPATGGQAINVP